MPKTGCNEVIFCCWTQFHKWKFYITIRACSRTFFFFSYVCVYTRKWNRIIYNQLSCRTCTVHNESQGLMPFWELFTSATANFGYRLLAVRVPSREHFEFEEVEVPRYYATRKVEPLLAEAHSRFASSCILKHSPCACFLPCVVLHDEFCLPSLSSYSA